MTIEEFAELKKAETAKLATLEQIIKLLESLTEDDREWVVEKINE
jgi:hypothetical protein